MAMGAKWRSAWRGGATGSDEAIKLIGLPKMSGRRRRRGGGSGQADNRLNAHKGGQGHEKRMRGRRTGAGKRLGGGGGGMRGMRSTSELAEARRESEGTNKCKAPKPRAQQQTLEET
jgi:hypothetical protein